MNKVKYLSSLLLVGALVLLPNCDLFKSGKETETAQPSQATLTRSSGPATTQPSGPLGEVLLTLHDEKLPKVTVNDFQNYKKELLEAQPNYASIIEFMPGANEQIFESLVSWKHLRFV